MPSERRSDGIFFERRASSGLRPQILLLIFRYKPADTDTDEAERVFRLRRDARHQHLRSLQQSCAVGQYGGISQRARDDAEIVGLQLERYALGFDVFARDLPPQVFGKMGQVSGSLPERQVFGQGDFCGNLEAFAFGFDGVLVRTARQIIEAVAVASEMI